MEFALSTHWNASRHTRGEDMVEEILALGFSRLELGYDLRMDLVPGVQDMIKRGAVRVDSVHNICPVPMGVSRGHPEIYTLASLDPHERQKAVQLTGETIRFAARMGAQVVVTHAGNVDMRHYSHELFDMALAGQAYTPRYEKIKMKLLEQRERHAQRHLEHLYQGLDQLLPVLREHQILLGIEVLPTWEAIPIETEFEALFRRYAGQPIRYWHDLGHGQIRQNMGFTHHERWLDRLQPHLAGMHVHDVAPPATDHVMPPRGQIDFNRFQRFATSARVLVVEPSSRAPASEVAEGLAFLKTTWDKPAEQPTQ